MKFLYKQPFLSFLAVVFYTCSIQANIFTADRIVAVVNRSAITQIELNERMASVQHNLARRHIAPPAIDILEKQVLEQMITETVLAQYAHHIGIKINEKVLDSSIQHIAEQRGYSVPDLKKQMETEGINWNQFREEVRQGMLMSYLKEHEVDSKVSVTNQEIDDYLNQIGDKPEMEYELAHIIVPIPENPSTEEMAAQRMRIEQAKAEIDRGQPFATVAATYSSASDATNGGYAGWRTAGALPPAFLKRIDSLSPGQVTGIIQASSFYIIIQLLNKRHPSDKTMIHQIHARHILIRPNELISEDEAKKKLILIRNRVLKGEKFEALARFYSDDTSAARGGDLGWVSPGEMVPQFRHAIQQLSTQSESNPISQPIKTPFGMHLIQVLGHRDQDMTKEYKRLKVRIELSQRKSDALLENWVNQLRDKAHIKLHLEDN